MAKCKKCKRDGAKKCREGLPPLCEDCFNKHLSEYVKCSRCNRELPRRNLFDGDLCPPCRFS